MTEKKDCVYESFPKRIVITRAGLAVSWFVAGALIMHQAGAWAMAVYLAYNILLFLGIVRLACTNCAYHGAWCDNGLGKVAGLFKPGNDRAAFVKWGKRSLVPLAIAAAVPLLTSAAVLLTRFSITAVILPALYIIVVFFIVLTTAKMACLHCKMRGLCPFSLYKPQR